jgi:hypothetical protein
MIHNDVLYHIIILYYYTLIRVIARLLICNTCLNLLIKIKFKIIYIKSHDIIINEFRI